MSTRKCECCGGEMGPKSKRSRCHGCNRLCCVDCKRETLNLAHDSGLPKATWKYCQQCAASLTAEDLQRLFLGGASQQLKPWHDVRIGLHGYWVYGRTARAVGGIIPRHFEFSDWLRKLTANKDEPDESTSEERYHGWTPEDREYWDET